MSLIALLVRQTILPIQRASCGPSSHITMASRPLPTQPPSILTREQRYARRVASRIAREAPVIQTESALSNSEPSDQPTGEGEENSLPPLNTPHPVLPAHISNAPPSSLTQNQANGLPSEDLMEDDEIFGSGSLSPGTMSS